MPWIGRKRATEARQKHERTTPRDSGFARSYSAKSVDTKNLSGLKNKPSCLLMAIRYERKLRPRDPAADRLLYGAGQGATHAPLIC